jgi:signal transduction histidine kinase
VLANISASIYLRNNFLIFFISDTTAARNYENQILIQCKNRGKIAMLQSHRVRAPTANIWGLVELFKNKLINESEINDLMSKVSEAAGSMDNAIRDVTDIVQQAQRRA